MFGKLFGNKKKEVQITEKQIHDALSISHGFLEVCNGFLPEDFDSTLTADKFYILIGFQFGAFSAAANTVGLTPSATAQIFPTLLETLNGVSKEKAQAIMGKIPDLYSAPYWKNVSVGDGKQVCQISPDKNTHFHCTTASFTLTTSDHWASLSCASSPPVQAFYDVSLRQLAVLLAASSPQHLAILQLPFASSYRLMGSLNGDLPTGDFHPISSCPRRAYTMPAT